MQICTPSPYSLKKLVPRLLDTKSTVQANFAYAVMWLELNMLSVLQTFRLEYDRVRIWLRVRLLRDI